MGMIFQPSQQPQMTPDQRREALQQHLIQQMLGNITPPASASLGQMGQVNDLWQMQNRYDQNHQDTPTTDSQPTRYPSFYGGGHPPTTALGGVGSIANGLAQWRQKQPDQQFPSAPDGASPSFLTGLRNMFGNNGGLY